MINTCPICFLPIRTPNRFVRFHVRYGPHPIVVLACSYCNLVERQLSRKLNVVDSVRALHVSTFMRRFDIII